MFHYNSKYIHRRFPVTSSIPELTIQPAEHHSRSLTTQSFSISEPSLIPHFKETQSPTSEVFIPTEDETNIDKHNIVWL